MSPDNPVFSATGLTARDYYAGLAMAALLSDPNTVGPAVEIARASVEMADALISELSKK